MSALMTDVWDGHLYDRDMYTWVEDAIASLYPAYHLHHLFQHNLLYQTMDWCHLIGVPNINVLVILYNRKQVQYSQ